MGSHDGWQMTTCPSEYDECVVFHQWLVAKRYKHAHISNESQSGGTNALIRGAKLKRIGQSKGFPDYIIICHQKGHPDYLDIVAVEMKRQHGGTLSDEQAWWLSALDEAGIWTGVCKGADDAIAFMEAVTNGQPIDAWQSAWHRKIKRLK